MEPDDFLDVLWLAARVPSGPAAPLTRYARSTTDPQAPSTAPALSDTLSEPGPQDLPRAGADQLTAQAEAAQQPHLAVLSGPAAGTPTGALRTPGDRALGRTLPLGRALRPLKLRVPSRQHSEVDEVATADLQADTRSPQLALRAQPERWLRLALIIDGGMSMLLWERQCAELKGLLERSGAFRQVEIHQIRYTTEEAGVRLGRPWNTTMATRPTECVTDASGRTMVLVVTDGAAAAWRDGRIRPVLEGWARNGPTAVIHTLPRRLWAGSGVRADTWQVTSPRPGVPNSAWTVTDQVLPPSVAPPPPVPIPVLDLTPTGFSTWAAVNTMVGRPMPVRLWTPHRPQTPAGKPSRVSVRDFGRAASPEAARLAAHLAAMAPVTVPVMQLVHSCLHQRQGTAPLAEVLLGGLMQPVLPSGDAQFNGRHQLFDFTAEAKDLLLDAVPTTELLDCSRRVGERIESLIGHSSDFPAWPLGPDDQVTATPFAHLGPALQARLGLPNAEADDTASDRAVLSPTTGEPSAEPAFAWVSNDGLNESLDLLSEELGIATLSGETDIPRWDSVMNLVDTVAERRGEPPADVRPRLRAQYVESLLHLCPSEVQAAFARVGSTPQDTALLLLHLLLYVHARSDGSRMTETEIAEDLSQFLDGRGLHLDRERRLGPEDTRRFDLLWRIDGRYCPVEFKRTGTPFSWKAAFTQTEHHLGLPGDSFVAGFVVAVDDDDKPTGPAPLEECVIGYAPPSHPNRMITGLRFQNGAAPAIRRVCIAVDTVGFAAMTAASQQSWRENLDGALRHAIQAAGVEPDACVRHDQGDGVLILLPPGADEARAVPGFAEGLAQALRHALEPGHTMRLRVAMDSGAVVTGRYGFAGESVERVNRLVGSDALREPQSGCALLVSETLYEEVPAFHGRFQRVNVRSKNLQAWAWLLSSLPERFRPSEPFAPSRSNAVMADEALSAGGHNLAKREPQKGTSMNASYYRSQLDRKNKARAGAEKKVGEFRKKEADKRAKATKERSAAAKASSQNTVNSKLRAAQRYENEANKAGQDASTWSAKVGKLSKEAADLSAKLAKAEQAERAAAEKARQREQQKTQRRAAAEQQKIESRLTATEGEVRMVMRELRAPKPEKLRVLLLAAASAGDLRVGQEQQRIRAAVQSATHRDLVDLDLHPAATADVFLDALTRFRPHVVHFSGHSTQDLIAFEKGEDGFHEGAIVSAGAFARAIAAVDDKPLLVLLNSCHSAAQTGKLVDTVPFAIGMSDSIGDVDAITYAARFYAAVADGQSIQAAHLLSQAAIEMNGLLGRDLPTLTCAANVDPSATRLVTPPPE
ncbi:SAV_2336 N-terminal domain-related protein [Streptomyces sp. G6]|uniref:SAV_2336 N-terminal domain-related protein n=1 Tax=Streptomyces sp. G6 TaxID=1178736 RepID=UPI003EDA2206